MRTPISFVFIWSLDHAYLPTKNRKSNFWKILNTFRWMNVTLDKIDLNSLPLESHLVPAPLEPVYIGKPILEKLWKWLLESVPGVGHLRSPGASHHHYTVGRVVSHNVDLNSFSKHIIIMDSLTIYILLFFFLQKRCECIC